MVQELLLVMAQDSPLSLNWSRLSTRANSSQPSPRSSRKLLNFCTTQKCCLHSYITVYFSFLDYQNFISLWLQKSILDLLDTSIMRFTQYRGYLLMIKYFFGIHVGLLFVIIQCKSTLSILHRETGVCTVSRE